MRGEVEFWGIAGDDMDCQSSGALDGQRRCQDQVEVEVDGREEVEPLMHGGHICLILKLTRI
jgi:hypothetical protein